MKNKNTRLTTDTVCSRSSLVMPLMDRKNETEATKRVDMLLVEILFFKKIKNKIEKVNTIILF